MGLNNHSVFLLNDSTVKAVGSNSNGQCGVGSITPTNQLALYLIPSLNNVKQIACGTSYTIFLLSDGTVKTIGSNGFGQCGTGNITTPQLTLYAIPSLTNVKQIACGSAFSVFLLNDGTVKTIGDNSFGQCGNSATTGTNQLTLFTIPSLTNVKSVSCGSSHLVFLLNDGTVKTVGRNFFGQCGTGTTTTQTVPFIMPGLTNVKQVVAGNGHSVFLLNDGTVKTIGQNDGGQCGTGNTTTPQLSLYTIPSLTNVKSISCGAYHNVFLLNDGTIKTVGQNDSGQCGTGNTTTPQLTLYTIPSLSNVKQISCGQSNSIFLLNDNTVKAIGYNNYGQCGNGSTNAVQLTLYTIPSLIIKCLWDNVLIIIIKYLIKQYSAYYSIKSTYYDGSNYKPLTLTGGSVPNKADIELYGFDSINDLNTSITIGSETFKPINKLLNIFSIKEYISK